MDLVMVYDGQNEYDIPESLSQVNAPIYLTEFPEGRFLWLRVDIVLRL